MRQNLCTTKTNKSKNLRELCEAKWNIETSHFRSRFSSPIFFGDSQRTKMKRKEKQKQKPIKSSGRKFLLQSQRFSLCSLSAFVAKPIYLFACNESYFKRFEIQCVNCNQQSKSLINFNHITNSDLFSHHFPKSREQRTSRAI